ncbi:hypothetical protein [Nocardia tengchongensis]|uniref:hypothetical protein n=1 Tax=Nocardia tengchongensis TaxID=2055889 RepID=UPI00366917E9
MLTANPLISAAILAAGEEFGSEIRDAVITVPALVGPGVTPQIWPLSGPFTDACIDSCGKSVRVIVVSSAGRTDVALLATAALLDALASAGVRVDGAVWVGALRVGQVWADLLSPLPGGVVTSPRDGDCVEDPSPLRRQFGIPVPASELDAAALDHADREEPVECVADYRRDHRGPNRAGSGRRGRSGSLSAVIA